MRPHESERRPSLGETCEGGFAHRAGGRGGRSGDVSRSVGRIGSASEEGREEDRDVCTRAVVHRRCAVAGSRQRVCPGHGSIQGRSPIRRPGAAGRDGKAHRRPDSGAERLTTTDARGEFHYNALPVGRYSLSARLKASSRSRSGCQGENRRRGVGDLPDGAGHSPRR